MNATPATVSGALAGLEAQGLPRLTAQLLALHVLQRPATDRGWLLAHDADSLSADVQAELDRLAQRHLNGEPLAYLTGHQAFYGLDLHVSSAVLVPRPDTETLVDWALEVLSSTTATPPRSVLDLGTGSGAIALALKAQRPDLTLLASDASPDALAVARANAERLNLALTFAVGRWFDALPPGTPAFDLIVSNPPYIAESDAHLSALSHEPRMALTSGADGLTDLSHIITRAPAHLRQGGWLLLEHGYDQAATVRGLLVAAGFEQVGSKRDLAGIERCSGGRWTTSV